MNENLIEYLKKIQNMANFFARGNQLETTDGEFYIAIVNDERAKKRNAFSLVKYSSYDILEEYYYGEQSSIGILLNNISNGEYEHQVEAKIDFLEPYTPVAEDAEFYYSAMRKIKIIIKTMFLTLMSGSKIPISQEDMIALQESILDEDEEIIEEPGYLFYHSHLDSFCLESKEGEIITDEISMDVGMDLYNDFLVEQEKQQLYEIIKNSRPDQNQTKEEEEPSLGE